MKIVSTSPSFAKISAKPLTLLKENNIEFVSLSPEISEKEFIQASQDAAGLIVGFNQLTAAVIERLPQLQIICKHGVGVDNIDVAYAKQKGIFVTNVPNANKHAVADFAFGLLLALARKLPQVDQNVKNGHWQRYFGADVHGKVLGIIGLGNIGKEVAKRAAGFDMQIYAYSPAPDPVFVSQYHINVVGLDELLRISDFVTIHTALLPATKNLLDLEKFKLMKPTAFLINTARGNIIVEKDLQIALKNHLIAGAALDVFATEPTHDQALLSQENLIATAHIAGYTPDALNQISLKCVQNIIAVLIKGTAPEFIVQ
ncbi:phosphoglycerate dehydrogenase [Loigolactobacillus binensis]|uniref:Phosphoglycerate dehydrogenase n=1 Tax=Loigolactobacillus binensis TaxID=2559922 RepID=A0ABW3E7X6_9LACO|nr:phosphoglycerate dehydrogenase [Loigolactobacillus binensis]